MSNNELVVHQTVTPMDLIERAQQSNSSIEQMQQLFELQLRYQSNEARKAYNEAMSNFRQECPTINRTRQGHNIKFAGLSESLEVVNPLLAKHGLSHQWKTRQEGNIITVECVVTHRLGHSESTTLSASPDKTGSKNDIQSIGSAVSYLSRYTLYAILGLSSREMDDDGQGKGKVETITEEEAFTLETLIENVKGSVTKEKAISSFCVYYKIDEIANLPAIKYDAAIKALEKKKGVA